MNEPQNIDSELLILINADIDGELSAEQRAELERELQASTAARELHAHLTAVDAALVNLPSLETPRDLHQSVITKLGGKAKPSGESKTHGGKSNDKKPKRSGSRGIGGWLTDHIGSHWQAGGVAIAVSAVVAVGVQQSLLSPAQHSSGGAMVGTVLPESRLDLDSATNRIDLQHSQLQGSLSWLRPVTQNATSLDLNLHVQSTTASEIALSVNSEVYSIEKVLTQSASAAPDTQLANDQVKLAAVDTTLYTIRLNANRTANDLKSSQNEPIEVKIMADKQLIFNEFIKLDQIN